MADRNVPPPIGVSPAEEWIDDFSDHVESSSLRGKAVSGAAYTAVSQALKVGFSISSQLLLSRLLFPSQFGIVAMVTPILAFAGLFTDLGLSQAVVQRQRITHKELNTLYWLGLAASSLCALLTTALAPLIAKAYHEHAVQGVCIALAWLMPLAAMAGNGSALLSRRMHFGKIAIVEVLSAAVGLAAGVCSALLHAGYWALVIAQATNTLTQVIANRQFSGWRPSMPSWTPTVKPMLRFGAHLTGFSLLSTFSLYSDNVLVGILRGPAALGLFDKSFSLVLRPVGMASAPISRVATPLLSRLLHKPDSYRRAYMSMLLASAFVTTPGLLVVSVMASPLVSGVLGTKWNGAAPIMTWISLAAMFLPFSGSSYWLFASQDRAEGQLKCGFISSSLILVSMLAGLHWGPVGIATSYALFAPLVHGSFIWVATQTGPVRLSTVAKGTYPLITGLSVAAVVVHRLASVLHFPGLINVGIVLVASYMVTAIVILIIPDGRKAASVLLKVKGGQAAL